MQQTRLGSLIESLFNVLIGLGIALTTQIIVFPWFGIYIELSQNLGIAGIFTVVSIVRSYVIRRWFNARLHSAAMKLGEKYERH